MIFLFALGQRIDVELAVQPLANLSNLKKSIQVPNIQKFSVHGDHSL